MAGKVNIVHALGHCSCMSNEIKLCNKSNSRIESTGNELVAVLVYKPTPIGSDKASPGVLGYAITRIQAKAKQDNSLPTTSNHSPA